MLSAHLIGILFALTSAFSWGSGDFAGGLATRRSNQLQVLAQALFWGLMALGVFAIVSGESLPSLTSSAWAAAAGVLGTIGVAALYRGLSLGNAAVVAPTAAVIGAVMPVLFGILLQGLPKPPHLLGFLAGMGGIWLVTRQSSPSAREARHSLALAIVAGIGFGGFFVVIAQLEPNLIFGPLVIAKIVGLAMAVTLLLTQGMKIPSPASNPIALYAGLLDAGGNVFYLFARQFTRFDIAAVLSSMYAVVTVMLSGMILSEDISRTQWLGVALCITALALISL